MLPDKIKDDAKQEIKTVYIAECLKMISKSAANFGGGNYMDVSLSELLHPAKNEKRTGDEIAADVIKKAGLAVLEEVR